MSSLLFNIQVTEDVVSVRRLAAEGVVDIDLDIEPVPTRPHEYIVSSFIQNTLTHKYQVNSEKNFEMRSKLRNRSN